MWSVPDHEETCMATSASGAQPSPTQPAQSHGMDDSINNFLLGEVLTGLGARSKRHHDGGCCQDKWPVLWCRLE
jgi:hypothetical protein